jgi:hypothetical protein
MFKNVAHRLSQKIKQVYASMFADFVAGKDFSDNAEIHGTLFSPPQTRYVWMVIGINFLMIAFAMVAPLSQISNSALVAKWFAWDASCVVTGVSAADKQAVFGSACWLLAANCISFFCLILLNAKAGLQRGTLSDFTDSSTPSCPVNLFDRALKKVGVLTLGMFLLLGLIILIILFRGMNRRCLEFVSIFTGGVYIFFLLINDFIAARAFIYCSKIVPFEDKQVGEMSVKLEAYRKRLRETRKDLSVYSKLVFFVDIPILVALIPIYSQKILLTHGPYKDGFVMGTIAMHVIVANLIGIAIDLVQHKKV